jgi:hypothetical protein
MRAAAANPSLKRIRIEPPPSLKNLKFYDEAKTNARLKALLSLSDEMYIHVYVPSVSNLSPATRYHVLSCIPHNSLLIQCRRTLSGVACYISRCTAIAQNRDGDIASIRVASSQSWYARLLRGSASRISTPALCYLRARLWSRLRRS